MSKIILLIIMFTFLTPFYHDDSLINKEFLNSKKIKETVSDRTQQSETEIYGIVLDEYKSRYGTDKILVVDETTHGSVSPDNSIERVSAFLTKKLPSNIPKEIIQNFREINKIPQKFQPNVATKVKYSMFEQENLLKINDSDTLNGQPIEEGIVSFSRIGFSYDGQNALVYIGYWDGTRTGWGYYTFLERKEGVWLVTNKILAWVS